MSDDIANQSDYGDSGNDSVISSLRKLRKPRVFVISGPSGVGKDSIVKLLHEIFPEIHVAVTATTRERRPGEANGVDYFFYDRDTFVRHREAGEFLESANVYGQWYGVPKHSVRHALERGQDVIVKVDVQGAATIRTIAPNAVFIFVAPSMVSELLHRLRHRDMDSPDALMRRFRTAEEELLQARSFDYVVFNEHSDNGLPERAVAQIHSIIDAERHRVTQNEVVL